MEVGAPRTHTRGVVLAGAAFVAVVLGYALATRRSPSQMWYMLDLQIYRSGGAAARHGTGLYELRYQLKLPFTYPPFAALIFEPLSFLRLNVLKVLVTGTSIVALLGTIWVTVRASAPTWSIARRRKVTLAVGAMAMCLEPVQQTLHFGQVNILLMVLVLADLLQPDDRRSKGVGTGIAAGFKLTPLIFLAYLLFTRRLRATITGGCAFLATVLVGAVTLPTESRRFWIDHLFLDSGRIGGLVNVTNQSLQGVLGRAAHGVGHAVPYWVPLEIIVAVAGLTVATHAYRRWNELSGVLLCALTGLLVSPVSWSHHWVYVAPALAGAVVFILTYRHRWALVLTAVGGLLFAAWPFPHPPGTGIVPHGLIWLEPNYHHREYRWHWYQMIVGNTEFLVGVTTLVVVGVMLRRGRDRSSPDEDAPQHVGAS